MFVHEDAVPVHLGPQLAGQRGAARNAQRHETPESATVLPPLSSTPLTRSSPRMAFTFSGQTVTSGGKDAVSRGSRWSAG